MARALSNVGCYIETDKDGNPQGTPLWTYDVADGAAKVGGKSYTDSAPDYTKTYHSTGVVGEFWRDGIDAIKARENIA